jgi:hypothetical protein
MIFLTLGAAIAGLWLWFFAPDVFSERARAVLTTLAFLVAAGSGWFSVQSVRAYADAGRKVVRSQNKVAARRQQQIQRASDEDADLSRPAPVALGR